MVVGVDRDHDVDVAEVERLKARVVVVVVMRRQVRVEAAELVEKCSPDDQAEPIQDGYFLEFSPRGTVAVVGTHPAAARDVLDAHELRDRVGRSVEVVASDSLCAEEAHDADGAELVQDARDLSVPVRLKT